ncbi:MAG: hypothetical protein N2544_11190 [Burkholderiales bacterium]|nr:hypothetical protein [Burkholderiales bacterium]
MIDAAQADAALALDPAWSAALRARWTALAELAVFGELRTQRLGALPRLRRKVLDLGERSRAVLAGRAWIPQPRERLKNALASALALREALAQVEAGIAELDGGADLDRLRAAFAALAQAVAALEPRMNAWAALLARRSQEDDNLPPSGAAAP